MKIVELIESHSGTVLDDLTNLIPSSSSSTSSLQSIIAVGHSSGSRRPSYLMALALGVQVLHSTWVVKSIARNKMLSRERYVLPTGSSPLQPYSIFRDHEPLQVFHTVRVANLAGKIWSTILSSAGGFLCTQDISSLMQTLKNEGRNKGTKVQIKPDYIVIDSLSLLSHNKNGASGQGSVESSIVHMVKEEERRSERSKSGITLVTTDWVVYCLQLGQLVDPSCCPLFAPRVTNSPCSSPLVYKGTGERYVVKDIVYFAYPSEHAAANPQSRGVGRIVEFVRQSINNSAMMVKLQLLHIERVQNRRMVSQDASQRFILVPADCLEGRPVVLTEAKYAEMGYTLGDVSILACEESWRREEEEKEEETEDEDSEDQQQRRQKICFSQDY